MFRGQFQHTIDAKGRVAMPSRFRELVGSKGSEKLILVPAPFDPCLQVFPLVEWERVEERIAELPSLDPNAVRFRRLYLSAAVECELDRPGRLLIPSHLRERAGLVGDVLWAGMGRMVELWSKSRWDEAMTLTPDEQASFQKAVMETLRI